MKQSIFALGVIASGFLHDHVFGANLIEEFKTNPPVYCANPNYEESFSKSRAIPGHRYDNNQEKGFQLSQVHVMTRHGARTTSRARQCWPDYDPEWICRNMAGTENQDAERFLFPKKLIEHPGPRKLQSTSCGFGQLLPMGYQQHQALGGMLADAYFLDSYPEKNLFDLKGNLEANRTLDGLIYFRSTDSQRTLMSGQQLLSSMIKKVSPTEEDPMITLHAAGKATETLKPNPHNCYDLEDAMQQAYSSKEYFDTFWRKNRPARQLAEEMMGIEAHPKAGKGAWPWHAQDCFGVSLCSGQPLPTGGNWTKENVDLIFAAATAEFEWPFIADNSRYSKIASAAFTYEVKASIVKYSCSFKGFERSCVKRFFDDEKDVDDMLGYVNSRDDIPKAPFIFWSGHETTIGPFLASFGPDFVRNIADRHFTKNSKFGGLRSFFPPYATLLAIELYEDKNDVSFRLIYNGRSITKHVPGCAKAKNICSVKALFDAMSWATLNFATNPCKMTKPIEASIEPPTMISSKAPTGNPT